jgi:hypothetical protein
VGGLIKSVLVWLAFIASLVIGYYLEIRAKDRNK